MDEKQHKEQRARRPYRKPELHQVPLRPEEAVLGACKNLAASGPGGGGTCKPVGWCSGQGS